MQGSQRCSENCCQDREVAAKVGLPLRWRLVTGQAGLQLSLLKSGLHSTNDTVVCFEVNKPCAQNVITS